MRDWADAVVALLLAPTCAACRQPLRHPTRGCVCEACWGGVHLPQALHCLRCGDADGQATRTSPWNRVAATAMLPSAAPASRCVHCDTVPASIDRARAIGPYAGALRDILHALKYDGRRSLAVPLAARMRQAGSDLFDGTEAVVPVPLHPRRRRERGFNQAADLARHLGLPVVDALVRRKSTPSQTTLHATERHENMRGAFTATARLAHLRGASILLVDDVRTTGATLDACALVLREAGVRAVFALTAARVESSQPR